MRHVGQRIVAVGFCLLATLAGGCGGGGGGASSGGDPGAPGSAAETVTSAEPAPTTTPAAVAPPAAAPVARSGPLLFLHAAADGESAVLLFSLPDLSPEARALPMAFAPTPDPTPGMAYDRVRDILYMPAISASGPVVRVFTHASAMTDNAVATRSILLGSDVLGPRELTVDPASDVLYISTMTFRGDILSPRWVFVENASTVSGPASVRDFQLAGGSEFPRVFDASRSLTYVQGNAGVDVYSSIAASGGGIQPARRIAGAPCVPLGIDEARDRLYCGVVGVVYVVDAASTPDAHVVKRLVLPFSRVAATLDATNDRLYMRDTLNEHVFYVQDRLSEQPDGASLAGTTFALPEDVHVMGLAAR